MIKKISKISIYLFILLFFVQNGLIAQQDKIKIYKKDPFLAGALSFYNPGLGQYYVGEPLKGTLFWVGENALFWSSLLTVMDLSINLKKDVGFEFKIKRKKNLSDERIYTSIGLGFAFIVLHIYNIIDAVNSAKKYNKSLEDRYFSQVTFDFRIEKYQDRTFYYIEHRF